MTKRADLEKAERDVLADHRGRKTKAPADVSELRKLQKLGASIAYLRLKVLAQSRKLQKNNPTLYVSLNQWLYEVVHGRPKVAIEGKLDVPIQITYRLVKRPGEIEQAEVIELIEEGKIESSSEDRPRDSTEPVKVN